MFKQSSYSFYILIRRSLESRSTVNQLDVAKKGGDQRLRLTVLDDRPNYTLRLKVDLSNSVPRVVAQMFTPEQPALPL